MNSLKNSAAKKRIVSKSHVTVFDINQAMLDVGKLRSEKLDFDLISDQLLIFLL